MLVDKLLRPVWAEINLDHLKHNVKEVKRVINQDTLLCAVIKADGYGHGAVAIAKTLMENGADRFAVATLTEAIQLRKGGVKLPILVLGYTPVDFWHELVKYELIQTIYTLEQGKALSALAKEGNHEIKIHIKVDTGMSRLGFLVQGETLEELKIICQLPNLVVEGIYTHFAVADEVDKTFTYRQFNLFMELVQQLDEAGFVIPIKHVSNSAAIIDLPEMNLNMVRAGIMLYGLYPSPEVDHDHVKLKQVMTLKVKAAHVKELSDNQGVSYGLTYRTKGQRKIMTLPIGYADGFTRLFTNKAEVIIDKQKAPVVGRICMDQSMVDVTGINVKEGDVVVVIHDDPKIGNTVDELASKLGTINYEIVCMIGKRIPRVYMENNNLLQVRDCLLE